MSGQELSYIEEQVLGKRVKLVKVEDCVYDGAHPNQVNRGYTKTGVCRQVFPYVYLYDVDNWFHTSFTKDIKQISDFQFEIRTKNSVYLMDLL